MIDEDREIRENYGTEFPKLKKVANVKYKKELKTLRDHRSNHQLQFMTLFDFKSIVLSQKNKQPKNKIK